MTDCVSCPRCGVWAMPYAQLLCSYCMLEVYECLIPPEKKERLVAWYWTLQNVATAP